MNSVRKIKSCTLAILTGVLSAVFLLSAGNVHAQPTWQTVTIPGLPTGAQFMGVWTSSPNDVYITGVTPTNVPDGFVFHWNGISWNQVLSLPGHNMGEVFGTGPSDIFVLSTECTSGLAVGCQASDGHYHGRIFRSTDGGNNWMPQILPSDVGSVGGGSGISGTAGNVHVIANNINHTSTHIIRFDGSNWSIVHTGAGPNNLAFISPDEGYFTSCWGWGKWNGVSWVFNGNQFDFCDVRTLWGTRDSGGALHLYTGGNNNFGNGVRVWKFNEVTSPCVPPGSPCSFGSKFGYVFADGNGFNFGDTYASWGSGPNDIYVGGRIEHDKGRVYHFDGTSWQQVTDLGLISTEVRRVWGSGPNDVWVTSIAQLFHFGEASPTTTCITPSSDMISWWPGDGNATDIKDGNNGTLMGGTTYAPGMVGDAFLLDGIDDFVDAGNAPNLNVSAGDFTVDAWVFFNALTHPPGANIGAPPGDMSIVDKMFTSGVNTDGWRLLKQNDNRFWFCFGGGTGNRCALPEFTVFSTTVATTGVWFHVAAVKSADSFSIYVNGQLEDSRSPVPSFLDTDSANLRIGSYALEASHLNGLIDEVEIFNRALSASEIQAIFNAGSAGKCKNLPLSPSPPTGVTAVAGDGQVTISWEDVAGATSYNLYMAAESEVTAANFGSLSEGMQHTGVSSPYTHTGLTNSTTYYFVVTALNIAGESAGSAEVSATPTSVVDTDGDGIPDADDECPLLPTTNTITGTAASETLVGTSANDLIRGFDGDDTLKGYGGDDCLVGGPGNDKIKGYAGDDILFGQNGDDDLRGGDGADFMDGGDGADRMTGDAGDDEMAGGAGNDRMSGRDGNDTMDGGSGGDKMSGGDGDDRMTGGLDRDRVSGRGGADTLVISAGDVPAGVTEKQSGGSDTDTLELGVGIGVDDITSGTVPRTIIVTDPTSGGTYKVRKVESVTNP